ncbi:MAG TPA: T9SS type A sorting domain-containing protein [Sunxiuqinia sp.]|nr:T9SS type A sorting domain-containing protein [Sunxiuqinia sp.]
MLSRILKTNKKILGIVVFVLLTVTVTMAQDVPAFPGAEGGGKYAIGGRGGRVIYVTNLDDNTTPGSLRYAVEQSGPRIIVFALSGTIALNSRLSIKNGDITIAGQTAPGDGICLRNYTLTVDADNVIIRFIRSRLGDVSGDQDDAMNGRRHKNIILDHCSMSWSVDETGSFYDNTNFTMQWCLLSESLRNSIHDKGRHGYGGIWGGKTASFHHNLLADHDSRNPRFCGSRYSNRPDLELVDFRNNVIYNWGANSSYAAEGGSYNMINNYFKAGPATSSSKADRIEQPYPDNGGNEQPAGVYGRFYINGNITTASSATTQDNWRGVDLASAFDQYGITKDDLKSDTPFTVPSVTTQPADKAYEQVLKYVGASLVRDTVDKRVIHDAETGTATITDGGNGSTNGLIDSQSAVGGWPELKSKPAPTDTDQDGMPDDWEDANNLDKNNPADAKLTTVDGQYTNVEVYINSLVADIVNNQNEGGTLTSAAQLKTDRNPLKMYYNKFTSQLNISHSTKIEKVYLYSTTGALIKTISANQKDLHVQLPALNNGVYLVRITDERKTCHSGKFVVTQ